MKTGEFLISINKKDTSYLIKEVLSLKTNNLSPFTEILKQDLKPTGEKSVFDTISMNKDMVYCLSILAEPEMCLRVNTAGPGTDYSRYNFCKTKEGTYVLSVESKDSFGIQYIEKSDEFVSFLSDVVLNDNNKTGDLFPELMNYEIMILFFNIIDSYRYVYYRDSLSHKSNNIYKLTLTEFNDLLNASSASLDFRWLVTNFIGLIPSAIKENFTSSEDNYNKLFDNGFLLSAKDNKTGSDYLLLNVMSIDAGAEFLNTWFKSSGVEICRISGDRTETTPIGFISATAINNHHFIFLSDDKVRYNSIDKKSFIEEFKDLFGKYTSEQKVKSENIKFCGNCGKQNDMEALFCRDCGFKLTFEVK